jgi:type IV pilus assembly protein PilN
MIRINLLNEGRRPVVAKKSRSSLSGINLGGIDLASAAMVGVVILALLVALGHNFLLGRKIKGRDVEIAEAQAEVDRLAPIIKEVEEFKAKKAELERKVQVISDLKANQLGPVRIMDRVSKALPELLWLQKMTVVANNVSLDGRAFNTNAVANFIENLDKVPEFQEPILQDTTQQNDVYTFKVTFSFTISPSDGEATSPAAGG